MTYVQLIRQWVGVIAMQKLITTKDD